jgi:hypothetical protein
METKLSEAVKVLIEALKTNEDYRRSWNDNIAMAFKDEYSRNRLKYKTRQDIHKIANTAANDFLKLLCK